MDDTNNGAARIEHTKRYVDLTVAVVAVEERIKHLAEAVDRIEEVLAMTVSALERVYGTKENGRRRRRRPAGSDTPEPAAN